MPNPIAHPAAAIPFTKVGMVFSALIIGSISPDFGYFILLSKSYFSHKILGLILFDMPVGFVLLWLFHTIVKWPLLSLLPENLQRRLFKPAQGFSLGSLKRFGLILLSLLVGSLTHVFWDSFTHEYGWIVEHIAFFNVSISGTPLYTTLQNLSTIFGIIILINWFIRWLRTTPQSDQVPAHFSSGIRAIFFVLMAFSLIAVEGMIIYLRVKTGWRFVPEHFLMDSIPVSASIIISFFVGIYCLVWRIAFNKTIRRTK